MLKKIQIIMLPTKEEVKNNGLYYAGDKYKLQYCDPFPNAASFELGYHKHELYFLSDEEIKEGDWYVHTGITHNEKEIYRYIYYCIKNTRKIEGRDELFVDGMFAKDCKKIIATTDNSLTIKNHPKGQQMYLLPKPSQFFLEVFVKEYNKGNKIEWVNVNYEQGERYTDPECPIGIGGGYFNSTLKVNPKDNTISIKQIKESWNREEVIKLIESRELEIRAFYRGPTEDGFPLLSPIDKWFEQNL